MVRETLRGVGNIDILLNNTGVTSISPLEKLDLGPGGRSSTLISREHPTAPKVIILHMTQKGRAGLASRGRNQRDPLPCPTRLRLHRRTDHHRQRGAPSIEKGGKER